MGLDLNRLARAAGEPVCGNKAPALCRPPKGERFDSDEGPPAGPPSGGRLADRELV